MQRIIEMIWGNSSQVKVSLAGPNLFVFSFLDCVLKQWVLENGPWHVQNKPLVLRKWLHGSQKLSFDLSCMPIWVQLYRVPLELYSKKGLSYIASAIGRPLYMDAITASKQRLEFAKVCVEIEVGSVIPDSIHVVLKDGSSVLIKVSVPWLPKSSKQSLQKPKEIQVWRKKDMSSLGNGSKDVITAIASAFEVSHENSSISKVVTNSPEPLSVNVHKATEMVQNMDLQVGPAIELSVKDLQENCGVNVPANVPVFVPSQDVQQGDFPPLQDSLKRKTKGGKNETIGSSSKTEGVAEGPRKTRVASLGVAVLFNEIKSKKKDHFEKAKGATVTLGSDGAVQSIPS
ncbi:uncharacterized protein LOC120180618 [Hibiscus syriacus]|uniref:uncharacterized protein LOC120180618 n=1 Tax=Hibiscus syriacus TaxID=106335 RepID=UPI0019230E38|nr:uncharacterized protein LOC120180618 [Hibiscus syriacus]